MSRVVLTLAFVVSLFSQIPEPKVVAPGVISTVAAESYITFTPDGGMAYFKRAADRAFETKPSIFVSRMENGRWKEPQIAPFSGTYSDADPFVSPDGQRLFFTSNRPVGGVEKKDRDIWVTERIPGGWGEPRHLGPVVNSDGMEASPTVSSDGTLYFSSTRKGGLGSGDLYAAKRAGETYSEPVNLGPAINSSHGEWNCVPAEDGSFLIFEGSGRQENLSPAGDLYISYWRNGKWTRAVHLGRLNSTASDMSPRLSPDGTRLYFASNRRDGSDDLEVLFVSLKPVLEQFPAKPE